MGKSKGNKVIVRAVGMSSTSVTGSAYIVETPTGEKLLLDYGLYQSNHPYEDFKINSKKPDFKPEELTAIFITHSHADHLSRVPLLVKYGFTGNIYISDKTIDFLEPLLLDSAKIMERDSFMFSKKLGKNIEPLYNAEDVLNTLPRFRGVRYDDEIKITDNVSVVFTDAGHVFGSAQLSLFVRTPSNSIKKISFTGDLGSTTFDNPFVGEFKPIVKTNLLIGEATYNSPSRTVKKEQREKDLEKLESVIRETCLEKKSRVLIPVFAYSRTEIILYYLYKIFGNDPTFKIPIIIDSPLAVKLLKCFEDNLTGKDKEVFDEMLAWKNVKIIKEYEESAAVIKDLSPKVVLSSSGMLTQGRSTLYLQEMLPKKDCHIVLCGYQAEGTVGRKIKDGKYEEIKINGKMYKNNANLTVLTSFSGHMDCCSLLNYYTNIANNGAESILLVHSDENKVEFKKLLEERVSKIGKTTKIISANRDQVVRI